MDSSMPVFLLFMEQTLQPLRLNCKKPLSPPSLPYRETSGDTVPAETGPGYTGTKEP